MNIVLTSSISIYQGHDQNLIQTYMLKDNRQRLCECKLGVGQQLARLEAFTVQAVEDVEQTDRHRAHELLFVLAFVVEEDQCPRPLAIVLKNVIY